MPERSRRHQEYVELHKVLSVRYDDTLYARSEAVNVALSRAAEDAADEEDYKRAVWTSTLALDDAKSLLRDLAGAEGALWEDLGDPTMAKEARSLADRTDSVVNMIALEEVEAEVLAHQERRQQLDEIAVRFVEDFAALEDIETWEAPDIPEGWREEMGARVAGRLAEGAARWSEITATARALDPAWTFDDASMWEPRHRRRNPFPDEVLFRRLEQHRRYRGQ